MSGPAGNAFAQLAQRPVRTGQSIGAEVQRRPVLRLQRQIAEGERVETLLFQLGDAEEVAGRLSHPRAGQHQQAAVHPDADDLMPGDRL